MPLKSSYSRSTRRYRKTGRTRKFYKKTRSTYGLAKQVARLAKQVKMKGPHNVNLFFNGQLLMNSNYSWVPLSNFNAIYTNTMGTYLGGSAAGQCFGFSNQDWNNSNKALLKSITIQWQLEANNEEDNINYSLFLVNIGKNGAAIYSKVTGALNTLSQPTHYLSNEGMAMLNKKYFNILRTEFGTLGNYGTALTSQGAQGDSLTTLKQGYWKIKPRRMITNPAGNFHELVASQDPSTQYYLLAVNNNSTADLESPQLRLNVVYSIDIDG